MSFTFLISLILHQAPQSYSGLQKYLFHIFLGGSCGISGKGSSPEGGWALERAPQGSGHSTKLCSRSCPVQNQELDLMILVGPFQLKIFYDSMTPSGLKLLTKKIIFILQHYYCDFRKTKFQQSKIKYTERNIFTALYVSASTSTRITSTRTTSTRATLLTSVAADQGTR